MTESQNFYCDGILGMPTAPRIITICADASIRIWKVLYILYTRIHRRGSFGILYLLNGMGHAYLNIRSLQLGIDESSQMLYKMRSTIVCFYAFILALDIIFFVFYWEISLKVIFEIIRNLNNNFMFIRVHSSSSFYLFLFVDFISNLLT